MLDNVLRLAADKGALTIDALAREMAVSPAVAEQLFAELVRLGYLAAVASQCAAPCGHCPVKEGCRFIRQPRLWVITEKGDRAFRRLSGRDGDACQGQEV